MIYLTKRSLFIGQSYLLICKVKSKSIEEILDCDDLGKQEYWQCTRCVEIQLSKYIVLGRDTRVCLQ